MGSYYPTSIGGEEESAGSMYQDDGTCTINNSSISIVLAGMNNIASSSSSCAYIENQTVFIMAPSTSTNNENGTVVVEKKLSGGNSAYYGDTAIIVSYNSDGTAGAVWVLDYNNTNNNNGTTTTTTTTSQQQQGSWEQTGILQTEYEDQLGWSVAIKGNSTFVVGAPGYQGMEVPLPSDGWFWSGRGNAIVMTKIDDDDDNGGGATSWVRQDELVPISANDTAGFGNSVDIAGRCLLSSISILYRKETLTLHFSISSFLTYDAFVPIFFL